MNREEYPFWQGGANRVGKRMPENVLGGSAPVNRSSRIVRWIVGIVLVCMLGAAGTLAYVGTLVRDIEQTISDLGTDEVVLPPQKANAKPIALLVLGTDFRPETRSANTDVIMVATLNPERKSATVVSLPRDAYIDPKGRPPAKANSFYAAYLYGRAFKDAPKNKDKRQLYAMKQIRSLYSDVFGIPIDYTVVVHFQTLVEVVDVFDGLTIDVDQDMCYKDSSDDTHIDLRKGEQVLDGKKTLDFVRYRKSQNCKKRTRASSDFERNARQQVVVSALLDNVLTPQGLIKANDVLEAISKHVDTDIPKTQIESIIKTYATMNKEHIAFMHLDGTWDGHYVRVSETDINESTAALQAQLSGNGVVATKPPLEKEPRKVRTEPPENKTEERKPAPREGEPVAPKPQEKKERLKNTDLQKQEQIKVDTKPTDEQKDEPQPVVPEEEPAQKEPVAKEPEPKEPVAKETKQPDEPKKQPKSDAPASNKKPSAKNPSTPEQDPNTEIPDAPPIQDGEQMPFGI